MAYTAIDKHTDYFNTITYSGTGGNGTTTTQAITGAGFQPDLVWLKQRTSTQQHQICDVLRGANNVILADASNAQLADSQIINSFDSDGFTAGYQDQANDTGHTYVSWLWKAGTTSGISAGSQTITPSSYSINTTAGFGIYKWSRTGASTTDYFSHGLDVKPTIAIQKRTDGVQDWYVNTTVIDGTNDNFHLNKTDAKEDDSTTVATSTNYYPKSPETGDYITYLFAPIKGFSAFGSYTGNGNADGAFVYTGFRPTWVMRKKTSGDSWMMCDNKRLGYNPKNAYLFANVTQAESDIERIDFLSNGFKLRTTDGGDNASGSTYIYMAFGQTLVGSNNVTAKAR